MNDADLHTFAIDTFSSDRKAVRGPSEMPKTDAVAYVAQRIADQHRAALSTAYWRARARDVLEEAQRQPGVACIHRTARGRGLIVTAEPLGTAAVFEVTVLPQFDDFEGVGEQFAVVEHANLAAAMREAGRQAEAWLQMDCEKVRREQERGPLVGFELTSPPASRRRCFPARPPRTGHRPRSRPSMHLFEDARAGGPGLSPRYPHEEIGAMTGCDSTPGDASDDAQVIEFEVDARTTVIETWRAVVDGAGDLDDVEVADRLEAELLAGNARFVARVDDHDRTRVVRRESVLRR